MHFEAESSLLHFKLLYKTDQSWIQFQAWGEIINVVFRKSWLPFSVGGQVASDDLDWYLGPADI